MPSIQLTPEANLKERFVVLGDFYGRDATTGKHIYRRSLEVRDKTSNADPHSLPDAIFVMINPGASKPLDQAAEGLTPTIPDKTQYQIMRVMEHMDWKFSRVLNLSDFREADKDTFLALIPVLSCSHSIFDKSRESERRALINTKGPVIAAWGFDPALDSLISNAISSLTDSGKTVVGRSACRNGRSNLYYHPLYQQTTWFNCILAQL